MKRLRETGRLDGGSTLIELLVSSASAVVILGALLSGAVAVRKSFSATERYVTGINNQSRLMDFVARDLRRAVRVGTLVGGVNTPLKNHTGFSITETNMLTINIPDYYATNTPDNATGSDFKTSRYSRARLDAAYIGNSNTKLNGVIPFSEAVTTVGSTQTSRFAPVSAGNGEIQIRYYRGLRSAQDRSVCYFRAEYPAGSSVVLSPPKEIAERVVDSLSTTGLTVIGSQNGKYFRLQSNFTPQYGLYRSVAGTDQFVEVSLRGTRRD